MFSSPVLDGLFLLCLVFMWLALFYHALLAVRGYGYFQFLKKEGEHLMGMMKELPGVSVIVPAKNEGMVIASCLDALLDLDYPKDKIEIIVVNDGSTDETKEVLDEYAKKYVRVKPVHVPVTGGFHGKSAALNEGLKHARYDCIAVFDADNQPERTAVQYLVRVLLKNQDYAAVSGKIRTLNRKSNMLTKFANIEFIAHQWLLQGGRWKSHKISMLPGTNYVIRKAVLIKAGGWDTKALAEDAELSLRLFSMGWLIAFFPLSTSWEQEPENWHVWRRQRLRWMQGNKYIVKRFLFDKSLRKANFYNILYMALIYYALVFFIALSDIILVLGLLNIVKLSVSGPLIALWVFAFTIFTLEIAIALTCEVGEATLPNLGLAALMYFTYCQQWLYVAVKSFIVAKENGTRAFWAKTERF